MTLEHRSFTVRAAAGDARTIEGIAVPYGQPADIAGLYTETIDRGAVAVPDSGKVMLYWRHSEPIGLITKFKDQADGWHITATISETPRGDEAYTLLRDGVVGELSIGFEPVEHRTDDVTGDVTRTKILVREVSVVPMGAYGDQARVTNVRESGATPTIDALERSTPDMPENNDTDLAEVRESVDELIRRVDTISVHDREAEPTADPRSAGEIIKALIARDESTTNRVNQIQERAYTGGTSADSPVKDAWVNDLTRIFDASSGVLASIFATDTLPRTGNNIEFAELDANTIAFDEQLAEGDTLAFGKVTLKTRTAPVKTYGGYTQLTRQEIERSTLPILNRHLEALALASGAKAKAVLRAEYDATYTARLALAANAGVVLLGSTLAAATYSNWSSSVIDAAIRFDGINLSLDHLVTSASVFKALDALKDSANRPIFDRTGTGSNSGGSLSLVGLTGNLAGVHVVLDPGATGDKAAFVNGQALRHYLSPVVSLQDDNIINLSKDFSAYRYGAVATEIPGAVVPIKLAAV